MDIADTALNGEGSAEESELFEPTFTLGGWKDPYADVVERKVLVLEIELEELGLCNIGKFVFPETIWDPCCVTGDVYAAIGGVYTVSALFVEEYGNCDTGVGTPFKFCPGSSWVGIDVL